MPVHRLVSTEMEGIQQEQPNQATQEPNNNQNERRNTKSGNANIAISIIKEIQNWLAQKGEGEREYKEQEEKLEKAIQHINTELEITKGIKNLQKEITKGFLEIKGSLTTTNPRSWAQVAQKTNLSNSTRTIHYRLEDKQAEEANKMPPAEIVEKIKSCGPQWVEVVAAKATKTGFQITTTSKTARERLEKEKPSMAFTSAKPLVKGYAI